jgi:polar amino acid transport system substrate-binding protein
MKIIKFTIIVLYFCTSFVSADTVKKTNNTITYAFAPWMPIVYVDSKGVSKGLYIEMLNELFVKELKMNLSVKSFPWKRSQKNVKDGLSDFLITIPTSERLKYTIPSETPLFNLYLHVYTYKNHKKINEIRKIKTAHDIKRLGLIPVSNLGNGWHKEHIDSYGVSTQYVSEDEQIAKFLAHKRSDILIDAPITMNHVIKTQGLSSKIVLTEAKFGPVMFYLLMGKKSEHIKLMPDINKALTKLHENGTFDRLIVKYNSLD